MAGMIGADLEQVRALAADFDRAAAQLNQTSTKVRNGIQISAWAGPFAVRFRHTWDSEHSVKLRQAANALSAQAKQLRLEADQQDRASAAASGSTAPPRTLQGSTRSLLDLDLNDEDGDGVVITEVLGEDGKRRFIVTIGGTRPFAGPLSNFDALENVDAVRGKTTQTMRYVEKLMSARGIQSTDDVMLVGYSQGGLIAQNIANSGRWGDPLIVTWASPQVQGGVGAHDIIRFEVEGDLVSDGLRHASLYIPDQEGDNYVVRGDAGADSGDRFFTAFGAAQAFGEGLGIHTGGRPFYGNLADDFDAREDMYARRLQDRMDPYVNGSIMSSS